MIRDGATVRFTNGNETDAERVNFKDGGWIGVFVEGGWVYYPPRHIARVVSREEKEQ